MDEFTPPSTAAMDTQELDVVETEARNTMFDCSLGVRGLIYYTESRVAYGAGAFFLVLMYVLS